MLNNNKNGAIEVGNQKCNNERPVLGTLLPNISSLLIFKEMDYTKYKFMKKLFFFPCSNVFKT